MMNLFASLTRAKMYGIIIAIGIALFAFAYFKGRGDGKEVVRVKVQEASTKAVLDAVADEREANANSEVRQDAEDTTKATIQKGIDDAKANGDNPIDGYFDGLRKSQSGDAKDKPAK